MKLTRNYLTSLFAFTLSVSLFLCSLPAAENFKNDEAPEIDFWYGERQQFGNLGDTQPLINILGSIKPVEQIGYAFFQVNGKRQQQFVRGPDMHRLAHPGDFNLEIDRKELKEGENTVTVSVRTPLGLDVKKTITVVYQKNSEWPLPYSVDFTKIENLQEVSEIIDGKWELTSDGVRTTEPYYDRMLAFGDSSWTDVEIVAEVLFHDHFVNFEGRNRGGPPYLDHAHSSFAMRWAGHPDDGLVPRRNWQNLGCLVALRAELGTPGAGSRWWYHFGSGSPENRGTKRSLMGEERFPIDTGKRYLYRIRSKTLAPLKTQYSSKVWPSGAEEPEAWQMESIDESDPVAGGSVAFVVHHSDVTLCRLQVKPINSEM